jgi:hypothetical protein
MLRKVVTDHFFLGWSMFSIINFGIFVKYESSGMLRFVCTSHVHGLGFAFGYFQKAYLMEHGCLFLPFSFLQMLCSIFSHCTLFFTGKLCDVCTCACLHVCEKGLREHLLHAGNCNIYLSSMLAA